MHDQDSADPTLTLSNPLSEAVSARDRDILSMVNTAIRKKRVLMAFQPVIQTARPDHMAFHEGLIRVLDHNGRIIPAREFIGVVENQELGRELDVLSLEIGLETLAKVPDLRLSINMSARSIGYPNWKRSLLRGLAKDATIAERLILEITEATAITIPEIVQVFMKDLQMKGVSFALDNFGAGFTALQYLRDFYFDILKIDGSFTKNIHACPDNRAITKAILAMARALEMFTVAQNVETYADASVLADLGADCMQGYYFGAPTVSPYWLKTASRRRKAG